MGSCVGRDERFGWNQDGEALGWGDVQNLKEDEDQSTG